MLPHHIWGNAGLLRLPATLLFGQRLHHRRVESPALLRPRWYGFVFSLVCNLLVLYICTVFVYLFTIWMARVPRSLHCFGVNAMCKIYLSIPCLLHSLTHVLSFTNFDFNITGIRFISFSVVDREAAWERLRMVNTFGAGNSKSNSLYWAASRAAPLPGFNASATPPRSPLSAVPSACSANSACDALGETYDC